MTVLDAKEWGWKGVLAFTLSILLIAGVLFLILIPEAGGDVTPTASDSDIVVAPSTGINGYDVGLLCSDPKTTVLYFPNPDAGSTYQLTRVDSNGVRESATLVYDRDGKLNTEFSRHFYDTIVGQDGEPAYVTDEAMKCLEKKAVIDAVR